MLPPRTRTQTKQARNFCFDQSFQSSGGQRARAKISLEEGIAGSFLCWELPKQRIWPSPGQLAERFPRTAPLPFLRDKRLGPECGSSLCPRFFSLYFPRPSLGSSWAASGLGQGGGNLTFTDCLWCVRDSGWCTNIDPPQSRELGRLSPTLQARKLRL